MLTTAERAARGQHAAAAPDYAALATQAVEALWAAPRSEWRERFGERAQDCYDAETRILRAWAKGRGVDVEQERAESRQRMSSGRMSTTYQERECERCERTFTPRGPSARYCHRRDCAQVAERKARAAA